MMKVYSRRQLMLEMGRPYDAEIEYLESTGTQYIDTGIVPHTPIVFDISLMFSSGVQQIDNQVISRVRDYSNRRICPVLIYHDTGKWDNVRFTMNLTNGNPNLIPVPIISDASYVYPNTIYRVHSEITASKYNLIVNDVDIIDGASSFGNISCSGFSMRLLSDNWTGTAQGFVKGKLYHCSIQMDGVLIRDFYPVRVGNVGYLYDKVSGQLFGNAGTGSFVLGPDKH